MTTNCLLGKPSRKAGERWSPVQRRIGRRQEAPVHVTLAAGAPPNALRAGNEVILVHAHVV